MNEVMRNQPEVTGIAVSMTVNGVARHGAVAPTARLSDALRGVFGCEGVKVGCDPAIAGPAPFWSMARRFAPV